MSKPGRGKPALLPYLEVTNPGYAATAASAFEVQEGQLGDLSLRGPCPRCGIVIEIPVFDYVVRKAGWPAVWRSRRTRASNPSSAPVMNPTKCRPEGQVGCGAYWNFTLSAGGRRAGRYAPRTSGRRPKPGPPATAMTCSGPSSGWNWCARK